MTPRSTLGAPARLGFALLLAAALCLVPAPRAAAAQALSPSPVSPANSGPYLTEGRRYINPTLQRYPNQNAAEVQEAISTLAGYTAFDHMAFTINAGLDQVTLYGQVTDPALARQAVAAVRTIPGITAVSSQITVLAPSDRDARLRQSVYDAVYGAPQLARYRGDSNPPIHIIVEDGRVTLVGVVADQRDRDIAYQRASRLAGAASARNELMVDAYAASDYPA